MQTGTRLISPRVPAFRRSLSLASFHTFTLEDTAAVRVTTALSPLRTLVFVFQKKYGKKKIFWRVLARVLGTFLKNDAQMDDVCVDNVAACHEVQWV